MQPLDYNISIIIKNTVKNIKIYYGPVVFGHQFINLPTKLIITLVVLHMTWSQKLLAKLPFKQD